VSAIWNLFTQPMTNGLLLLYDYLGSFALSIAIFTVLMRVLIIPLTLPQQRSAKKMQELQQSPDWQEIQKKYAKDREKLAQAQMEMYKKYGVNPLGGCLPLLIQFPIWIGLYNAIYQLLGTTPLNLLDLSRNLYPSLPSLSSLVPLQSKFLWMDLGRPDQLYILPVLVAATTWFSQKVMTPPSAGADDQTASMTQSMQWMMPMMFGFFSLQFPAGLSIYFIVSNLVGVVIQYFTTGWVGIDLGRKTKAMPPAKAKLAIEEPDKDTSKDEEAKRNARKRRKRRG
jgi:YidC/Oxa1 family membrane protein insertase